MQEAHEATVAAMQREYQQDIADLQVQFIGIINVWVYMSLKRQDRKIEALTSLSFSRILFFLLFLSLLDTDVVAKY